MPELPEVETTRRGIDPYVVGRRIEALVVREPRLRWPVPEELPGRVAGQRVLRTARRAKYLLLELERGTLLLHLGMSGSLRMLPAGVPPRRHDHLELQLDSGASLHFNDPRRFGSLHYTEADPAVHPLLARLAPEPFDPGFTGEYLWRITRRRRVPVKSLLMNSRLVVGVGNIYASEALYRAGIRPTRTAGRLTRPELERLAHAVRAVLTGAVRAGGTTLRDYVGADGRPGAFRRKLFVYERAGEPCRHCGVRIRRIAQGRRSSYFCPNCQR
ncbi:MAG: bifunctional DNA-formamidopyrimidine glycosylase/DNA-(apurinic or apyrimidinic site) lyase [Gammaproteobacteria bacterium]|nr:bifunctional DNA-formamidopyrimidine glycosylase/DNA-(apurinic or apyrimidinic site) lyase [Gammaproteobacteria bacterium]